MFLGNRRRLLVGLILILVPFMLGLGIASWALAGPEAMPDAQSALLSDEAVRVEQDEWIVFTPAELAPTAGLVIYPGARVAPEAYAPLARAVAEAGYLAVIVPMPLNLAVLAPNRAAEVIAAFPEVSKWAIAGHSLGGSMAASFAESRPGTVQGLALWASYPAQSTNLSDNNLQVISVFGTLDGLTSLDDIRASADLLPADARWVAVEGGNHAQFGSYGDQTGDNPATVSAEAQQAQIVAATLELLYSLANGN